MCFSEGDLPGADGRTIKALEGLPQRDSQTTFWAWMTHHAIGVELLVSFAGPRARPRWRSLCSRASAFLSRSARQPSNLISIARQQPRAGHAAEPG